MSQVDIAAIANRIVGNIEKVIIGKRPQLALAVSAYFCEGHILLEDVPGVAKTMLLTVEHRGQVNLYSKRVFRDETWIRTRHDLHWTVTVKRIGAEGSLSGCWGVIVIALAPKGNLRSQIHRIKQYRHQMRHVQQELTSLGLP